MLTFYNPSQDPFYNQAFEEIVFESFRDEDIFFLWQNRPVVVVGRHQNICREVHVMALHRMGIPVIRRISGGGTVYHDLGNINYTYITKQEGAVGYDRHLMPVIEALNAIGIPARKRGICDIAIGEKKISGSAQRSAGGRVLHHGTLLFQADLEMLDQITMQHKNDCYHSKGTDSAICAVTNISEHLTEPMDIETFQEGLLAQMLPDGSERVSLDQKQEEAVCRLRDEKYHSWSWTWGKTPAFTYEKMGNFAGKPIRVVYRARGGILSDVICECEAIDDTHVMRLLEGQHLEPIYFEQVARQIAGDHAEEFLNWLI